MSLPFENKLPPAFFMEDPLDRRAALLLDGAPQRVEQAVEFMKVTYKDSRLFESCRIFVFTDLLDAPRSDISALTRVWFFPWVEAQLELSEALNHALFGNYKAVYDNCRRALELAVVGTYFQQAHVSKEKAKEWMRSEKETPPFSRALKSLLKNDRFAAIDKETGWSGTVSRIYWDLCDFVHVRGPRFKFRKVQPFHHQINDVFIREFSVKRLESTLDSFVLVCRHMALMLSLENPVLLVGLEMFQKFGFNPPASGYFEDVQAVRLKELLPAEFATAMTRLAAEDAEVRGVVEWFNSMPDISDEEVKQQLREDEGLWETSKSTASRSRK